MKRNRVWFAGAGLVLVSWSAGCSLFGGAGQGAVATGATVLNTGVALETEHNQVVRIAQTVGKKDYRYTVLFGPYPPGPGNKGRGMFKNSDPTWHVEGGYTYAIGWWPIVSTKRVVAISEATTMVVWAMNDRDRVFLLDPQQASLRVQLASNSGTYRMLTQNTYVEAVGPTSGPVTLSEPTPIPTDPADPIRQFLDYVLARAEAADM